MSAGRENCSKRALATSGAALKSMGNPASRWDVYADDEVICSTPCARWVNPNRPVMLRTREAGFLGPSDRVQVDHLLGHPGQAHLQLHARGEVHFDFSLLAQGTGDDVALRIVAGLLFGQRAGTHALRDQ